MKKFRIRAIFMCMLAMGIVILCPFGASANDVQMNKGLRIIETAGMNGYYSYNARTGKATFISVEQYAPTNTNEEIAVPQEEADPNVLNNAYTEFHENGGMSAMGEFTTVEPFAIIGDDDRTAVADEVAGSGQYVNTCLIVARYKDNTKAYGTGFTLDNYHVFTAGHLAYDADHGGYADHFAVYAGCHNGTYKKYSLAYEYDVGEGFINNSYSEDAYRYRGMYDDWAILKCDTALGVGHLGRQITNNASSMMSHVYFTQGYPADRNNVDDGLNDLINCRMYTTTGYVLGDMYGPADYQDVVGIDLDITKGQSGSPIYRYISGLGYCAQAMALAGDDILDQNYAILINSYLHNLISDVVN